MKAILLFFLLTASAVFSQNHVQGTRLTINGPGSISGLLTLPGARITAAPAMTSHVINVALADQIDSIAANTTLTLSGTPGTNTWFGFTIVADGTARVVTLPAGTWYSDVVGTTTTFTVGANQTAFLQVKYDGTKYNIFGAPYSYLDFSTNTTPASTAVILTQNASTGVLERSTKAQLQTDIGIADTGAIFTATNVEGALLELAKVPVKTTATNYTVGTTDPRELYGGVIRVTGACTITVPAVAAGASFTVITIGAVAVSVDVNASDLIYLNGTALSDGDKITNGSTAGDVAVFTYAGADGWDALTNTGWTDTN